MCFSRIWHSPPRVVRADEAEAAEEARQRTDDVVRAPRRIDPHTSPAPELSSQTRCV